MLVVPAVWDAEVGETGEDRDLVVKVRPVLRRGERGLVDVRAICRCGRDLVTQ